MTYELTDEIKEEYGWIGQKRIQLAQFLHNVAVVWISPIDEDD